MNNEITCDYLYTSGYRQFHFASEACIVVKYMLWFQNYINEKTSELLFKLTVSDGHMASTVHPISPITIYIIPRDITEQTNWSNQNGLFVCFHFVPYIVTKLCQLFIC